MPLRAVVACAALMMAAPDETNASTLEHLLLLLFLLLGVRIHSPLSFFLVIVKVNLSRPSHPPQDAAVLAFHKPASDHLLVVTPPLPLPPPLAPSRPPVPPKPPPCCNAAGPPTCLPGPQPAGRRGPRLPRCYSWHAAAPLRPLRAHTPAAVTTAACAVASVGDTGDHTLGRMARCCPHAWRH